LCPTRVRKTASRICAPKWRRTPDKSEADELELIASTYGAPGEVASAFRDTEAKVKAAMTTPRKIPESGAGALFGVFLDSLTYTSPFFPRSPMGGATGGGAAHRRDRSAQRLEQGGRIGVAIGARLREGDRRLLVGLLRADQRQVTD
jgi:hypothetical protein